MGCFLEKDSGNIYIKISPYQNLAGIWTQIKRRVKISSINFGNFSNYKCYFVSVGREIGRTMFLTQKVGSKYGSKYSNMMQFMQKHTYLQLFLSNFVVSGFLSTNLKHVDITYFNIKNVAYLKKMER